MNKLCVFAVSLFFVACTLVKAGPRETTFIMTKNKIHILTLSKNVQVFCSPVNKEYNNNFTYLKVKFQGQAHQFLFRRPWNDETCQWRTTEISKIIKNHDFVSLLGITSIKDKDGTTAWIFDFIKGEVRKGDRQIIKGKKPCHGYFNLSCRPGRVAEIIND